MKAEEVHPILANIPLIVLNNNINEGKFLNEQGIAINTNESHIGKVANCPYSMEITYLGNQEVQDILLKSKLSQDDSMIIWSWDMVVETSTKTFITFWEEFCFASVRLLIFKTKTSNFFGEYVKYQGREHFWANFPFYA